MPTLLFGRNTGNSGGCEDSEIAEANPDRNYGISADMATHVFITGDSRHSLIRFTGLNVIPSNATITSAALKLYMSASDGSGPNNRTVAWRRTLRAWVEGTEDNSTGDVSWNEWTSGNAWTTPGGTGSGDRVSTISAQLVLPDTPGVYYSFTGAQLTADVQDYVSGSITDLAWIGTDEGLIDEEQYRVWRSSEGTDGQRPYLEVVYTTPPPPTLQYHQSRRLVRPR